MDSRTRYLEKYHCFTGLHGRFIVAVLDELDCFQCIQEINNVDLNSDFIFGCSLGKRASFVFFFFLFFFVFVVVAVKPTEFVDENADLFRRISVDWPFQAHQPYQIFYGIPNFSLVSLKCG